MDWDLVWELVREGGAAASLALVIVAIIRAWLVPGYVYRIAIKERDEWKRHALRNTELAESTTAATERGVVLLAEAIRTVQEAAEEKR